MADEPKIPQGSAGTNRPAPARMPRADFLAEFGDATVDSNTLGELEDLQRRSGEPDELPSLEQIVNGQVPAKPEKIAPQEREAFQLPGNEQIDPASLPETQDPAKEEFTLEERYKILEAQTQAQLQEYQRKLDALQSSPRQAEPPKPPSDVVPDFMNVSAGEIEELAKYDPFTAQFIQQQQHGYRLEQQVKQLTARDAVREQQIIGTKFDNDIAAIRAKHPDFDVYFKNAANEDNMSLPQLLDLAKKQVIASGNSSVDIAGWAESVYYQHVGKAHAGQAQKAQDELNKKREDKRQESIKAVSGVASGGSTYQPPQAKSKDPSMRGGREEMLAELRSLGLGR
jgi:hypothetical protein